MRRLTTTNVALMSRGWIGASSLPPEYIRKSEVFKIGKLVKRNASEKSGTSSHSFRRESRKPSYSAETLSGQERGDRGFGFGTCRGTSSSGIGVVAHSGRGARPQGAEKFLGVDAVQNAQCGGSSGWPVAEPRAFRSRKRAWRAKIELARVCPRSTGSYRMPPGRTAPTRNESAEEGPWIGNQRLARSEGAGWGYSS